MRKVVAYSDSEQALLKGLQKFLIDHFLKIESNLTIGIFIRPKPSNARDGVIELNYMLGDFINVNYQAEDFEKVEDYTKYIDDLVSNSIIVGYLFESELQQIGRISPYLWMGNNMYKLNKI